MTRPSRRTVGFAALCILLILFGVWQALEPVSSVPVDASIQPESLVPPPAVSAPSVFPQFSAFEETWRRPLFVSGRKPTSTNAPTASAGEASSLSKYAIVGIVAAPDHAEAVIRTPEGGMLRLRAGQAIEGWTLQTIQPRKLIFGSADGRQAAEIKIGRHGESHNALGAQDDGMVAK